MPQRKMPSKRSRRGKRPVYTGVSSNPQAGAYPPRKTVDLAYADVFTLTEAAAGAGVTQIMRTGDVYDPDFTGLGHQPMYFDQLCTSAGPYLLHTTHKYKAHLRFVNTGSTAVLVTVRFAMASAAAANRTQAAELPFSWQHILPPVNTGGAMKEHTVTLDNPRFVGVPPATYEADYSGGYGTASAGPYMVITVYGLGASVATVTLHLASVYKTTFYQLGPTGTS